MVIYAKLSSLCPGLTQREGEKRYFPLYLFYVHPPPLFEIGSYYVALARLKLLILLPQASRDLRSQMCITRPTAFSCTQHEGLHEQEGALGVRAGIPFFFPHFILLRRASANLLDFYYRNQNL